jgi:hypothetical protein
MPKMADPDMDGDVGKSESAKNEAAEERAEPIALKNAERGKPETAASEQVEDYGTPMMKRDMQRMAARKSGPKVI